MMTNVAPDQPAASSAAVSLMRYQVRWAREWFDGTVANVTAEQAAWAPPGIANPLGATYAHLVMAEDMIVQGLLRQTTPEYAAAFAGRTGLSEPMPQPHADWGPEYHAWAGRVRVDLAALKEYMLAVRAATDEYLESLTDADLGRTLDLSAMGPGRQPLAWVLTTMIVNHYAMESGEIACLKGLQGARGYPG